MTDRKKTGSLAQQAAVFSAFLQAAGKTLMTGLGQTAAERQIEVLPKGRMRVWASNVRLHFDDQVVLNLDDVVADIQLDDPEAPLIPERTDQYAFHLLKGRVRLKAATIESLLGRYLFAGAGLPLANPRVSLDDRGMRLDADLSWGMVNVAITLAGPLERGPRGTIDLVAARVQAAGWGLGPLLGLLRTDLERVLPVPPGGALAVSGNRLELDAEKIFPNPRAQGHPTEIAVAGGDLVLTYDTDEELREPPLIDQDAPAYLFCLGHNLLVGKMFLNDAVFQVVPRSAEADFVDFSLQDYRKQLAAGESTLKQHGELLVRMPSMDEISEAYSNLNGPLAPSRQRSPFRKRQAE